MFRNIFAIINYKEVILLILMVEKIRIIAINIIYEMFMRLPQGAAKSLIA